MKPILIFDADGVMTLPEDKFTILYSKSHGLDPEPFENFFRTEWADYVTGKKDLKQHITNNPELWQWKGDADSLLKYWFESEDIKNTELIALIKKFRRSGVKCYLATEQEKYRGEYMKNVMFPNMFDGFFNTADIGVKKNDPQFFEKVIEELRKENPQITAKDIILFDDSQSKVDAAKNAGVNAVLYTGVETVKQAITNLEKIEL